MKNLYYNVIIVFLGIVIAAFNIDIKTDSSSNSNYGYSSYNNDGSFHVTNPIVPNNPLVPINANPTPINKNVPTVLKENEFMSAAFDYSLGDARLIGESGSMQADIALSINPIDGDQLPPLNQGMVNVTADNSGYQMLPKGMVFKNDIDIILPYDTTLLPVGFTPNDIKTYYYDETYKRWIEIPRDSVDEANQLVVSKVNHFTDFINAILKTPEMPETSAFAPTQMNDIKAANPLEGFSLMQPPSPNNMGTANLGYPLWIPAGRQGMQPELTLSYSSSGENGWMGQGWDINIPMITTETRWGVPYHKSNYESETYLLNGEQLATKYLDILTGNLKYNTLAHKAPWKLRNSNVDTTRFYPRVEGSFQKIIRHGTSPSNYWWEITDKTGVKYFYGKKINSDEYDINSVLADYEGHICKWGLTEIRDLNGNFVQYKYTIAGSTEIEKFLIIDKIIYTSYNDGSNIEDGKYSIEFIKSNRIFSDESTNCRLGVVEKNDKLLNRIDIKYENEYIKGYLFEYKKGAFGKTLLDNLYEINDSAFYKNLHIGAIDKLVKTHSFEYYEQSGNVFSDEISINTNIDMEILGVTLPIPNMEEHGKGYSSFSDFDWNIGGSLDIGLYNDPMTKFVTLGGNYMYTNGTNKSLMTLVDIDGDGLPDKVFRDFYTGKLKYRKMLNNGTSYYFSEKNVITWDYPFGRTKSHTHGFGVELQAEYEGAGSSMGFQRSKTKSYTSTFFKDVDGDGLIDISKDEKVYLNRPINGTPFFTPFTTNMALIGGICDADTIYFGDTIPNSYYNSGDTIFTYIVTKNGIDSIATIIPEETQFLPSHDAVRMWVAPYDGIIFLKSIASLTPNLQNARRETKILDGVKFVLQKNDTKLYENFLNPQDSVKQYNNILNVNRGDKLFFRIESVNSRSFDVVLWSPHITYLNYSGTSCDTNIINAEGKKSFVYDSNNDFYVNLERKYFMPLSGTGLVNFESKFTIEEELSDTINIFLYKNNNIVLTRTFPKNTIINELIIDTIGLAIAYNDSIWVKVESKTNVNWQKIKWLPILYYDSTTEQGISLYCVSPDGVQNTPQIKWDVIPQYTYFANSHYPTIPYIPSQNVQITSIRPYADGYTGTEPIVFSIKNDNGVVFQKTFLNTIQDINLNITLLANTKYYFEWFTCHEYDLTSFPITNASCIIAPGLSIPMGFYSNHLKDNIIFGNLYRGWGQFSYKRESPNSIINQLLLKLSTFALNPVLDINVAPNLIGDLAGEGFINFDNAYDPLNENFLMMEPDVKNNKWIGYANITYVCSDTISNTFVFEQTEDDVMFPDNVVTTSSSPRSIKLESKTISNQFSISFGLGLPQSIEDFGNQTGLSFSFGNGYTWGHSKDIKNFIDMNGDGFPDVRTNYVTNYTTPLGGISHGLLYGCVPSEEWVNDYSENNGRSANYGGKYDFQKSKAGLATRKARGSVASLGVQNSANSNETNSIWLDINGDGLPDNLSENGTYFLNVGYQYVNYSKSLTLNLGSSNAIGGSFGYANMPTDFNKFNTSYSGGLGYSDNSQTTETMMIDINNDGLIDLLTSNNGVNVQYNNGNSFTGNSPLNNITELNSSSGFSTNLYAAVGFGFPVWILKIVINPQGGASWAMSNNDVDFIDMNADGLVDYVKRDGDNIKVRYNNLKKVNTLKTVNNLIGGSFTIDYGLSKNNFDSPTKHLIMTSLKIDDGFEGDGEDIQYSEFEYDNPQYNRSDRVSYGFETVITKNINFSTQEVYRILTEKYHNTEYSRKGLKNYELITDSNNNKFIEKYFLFVAKEIETGQPINSERPFCYGEGYPALNEEIVNYYEGSPNVGITTSVTYEHGPYGNVISCHDYQNSNETSDDIISEITYQNDTLNKHLIGIPASITVKDINNNILRYRACEMNASNGHIELIHNYNNGVSSDFDYHYDDYGNIDYVVNPENVNQQRLEYSYVFDSDIHTYPIQIINNSFGYSSYASYNLKFGKPTNISDVNGNQIDYKYDSWGRTTLVKSPIDPDSTITFYYGIDISSNVFGNYAYSRTVHYDQFHPNNGIETYLIVDGLGRVVQSKKDIEINGIECRSVSGKQIYDGFGRLVESYYPVVELITTQTPLLNTDIDPTSPTLYTYDVLGRSISFTLPNNVSSSTDYSIENYLFKTTFTDPLSNQSTNYHDTRGLDVRVVDANNSNTIFYYNAIGELVQSTDPDGHSTNYSYNMLGQRTSRLHPDSGLDTMFYDPAGNLIWRQTQNLSGISPIQYSYDYNRLINVNYPLNPENNVDYYYGDNTTENRLGRLWAIEDASGRQEFSFGKQGEIVENTHTFIFPNEYNPYTLKMFFEYDSWNRLIKMKYPDKEDVYYDYNYGGQLFRMYSEYNNFDYNYIDNITYNKFEQRDTITYGNGVTTIYSYDILQRLSNLTSISNNEILQNNDYSYDDNNNILGIVNYAGIINNGLGGQYTHYYGYDNINRLTTSGGNWSNGNTTLNYSLRMQYENDGRIGFKDLSVNTFLNGILENVNYQNSYSYNEHKVENVFDDYNQSSICFEWDPNGNLIYERFEFPYENERKLCWDEENRLMAVGDNNYTSLYVYNNGGERTYKLTGTNSRMNINGNWMYVTNLNNPTLYYNGFFVANTKGYTKHYYNGSERIASAIGLGGLEDINNPLDLNSYNHNYRTKSEVLLEQLDRSMSGCLNFGFSTSEDMTLLYNLEMPTSGIMDQYFYLTDHLGSSSWITDFNGDAIQQLNYLPFGEDWVDQRNSSWNAPYTFSGKEKDAETGYGYFGARYYDSGLGIWLSVDNMSDKYSSISPYNYCTNNPVILKDPDGNDPILGTGLNVSIKVGYGSNGFNYNLTASAGLQFKSPYFQAVTFSSLSLYGGQQLGTSYLTKGCQFDITAGAYFSGGWGEGSPHKFYTLNFNTPSPFNNTFEWSATYGQMLTYNSAINAFGDGPGIQSQGLIGFRFGENFSLSTNNDTQKYGSNLIFNRGKIIDAGWSGGIVINLFDVYFGYQNFTGYWPEFADTKYKYGDQFTAESRIWKNGAYHQSLNRAYNFFQFPNNFGFGIYSEAWFQNFIHIITNNGTYIYNNQGSVNATISQ